MPAPRVGALNNDARLTSVCLSDAYIGPKSRTERPRKTKIGTEVVHVTRDCDTTFKVKRSKVNLQGAGAYCGGLLHSPEWVDTPAPGNCPLKRMCVMGMLGGGLAHTGVGMRVCVLVCDVNVLSLPLNTFIMPFMLLELNYFYLLLHDIKISCCL